MGAAVALAIAAAAVAAPAASADVEPNGAVFTAEGPISGGQDIQGAVGAGDTDDWYVVQVEGVHQLHLETNPPQTVGALLPTCNALVQLTDGNGSAIPPDFTSRPGTSTFYVHVSLPKDRSCQPEVAYSFRLDPVEAFVTGPGKLPIKGTAEPNNTRSTAGGPLVSGAWYHSELETVNDEDWLRLYVRPGKRVDVQVVVYGPECATHEVALRDRRGVEVASYRDRETLGHLTDRSRNGARYYLEIANGATSAFEAERCVHSATVVQVTPEDAVMTAAQVRTACSSARAAARRDARRVASRERAVAGAKARGQATGALRRKLKRDRAALKRSNAQVAAYCSK